MGQGRIQSPISQTYRSIQVVRSKQLCTLRTFLSQVFVHDMQGVCDILPREFWEVLSSVYLLWSFCNISKNLGEWERWRVWRRSQWVDERLIHEPKIKIWYSHLTVLGYLLIMKTFFLDDRVHMRTTEGLSSCWSVSFVAQPIRYLLKPPTFVSKIWDRIVKKLLVRGVGCNPKIWCAQIYVEG